jgi:hypothetical protein
MGGSPASTGKEGKGGRLDQLNLRQRLIWEWREWLGWCPTEPSDLL